MKEREWINGEEAMILLGLSQPQLSRLSHPARIRRKPANETGANARKWLYYRPDIDALLQGKSNE